ncbi:MAG: hypothetical protein M0R66_01205 [Candidatus Omnitrophica bacterium]|nr:hypothetical protein [Candidatus Omnitrophota bacterium]
MKIPQTHIDVLKQDCRAMYDALPESLKNKPGIILQFEPLILYAQKYASFQELVYHPVVAIGGRIDGASDKRIIHFRPKELAAPGEPVEEDVLVWACATSDAPPGSVSWDVMNAQDDYVVKPV